MVFIGYYVALAAQQHDALPAFSAVMEWFVLPLTVVPLTVVTLAVVTWCVLKARKQGTELVGTDQAG